MAYFDAAASHPMPTRAPANFAGQGVLSLSDLISEVALKVVNLVERLFRLG